MRTYKLLIKRTEAQRLCVKVKDRNDTVAGRFNDEIKRGSKSKICTKHKKKVNSSGKKL